jgi:hypothetical protein
MAKGRKTGGRQAGTRNKVSREAVQKAQETGDLPADILLRLAREAELHYRDVAKRPKVKPAVLVALRTHAKDCAQAAAPYFNPKLSTIEAKVKGDLGLTVTIVRQGDDGAGRAADA